MVNNAHHRLDHLPVMPDIERTMEKHIHFLLRTVNEADSDSVFRELVQVSPFFLSFLAVWLNWCFVFGLHAFRFSVDFSLPWSNGSFCLIEIVERLFLSITQRRGCGITLLQLLYVLAREHQ